MDPWKVVTSSNPDKYLQEQATTRAANASGSTGFLGPKTADGRDQGYNANSPQGWTDVTDYSAPGFQPWAPPPGAGGQSGQLLTPGYGEQTFGYYAGQGAWDPNKTMAGAAAPAALGSIYGAQQQNAQGYDWSSQMFNSGSRADQAFRGANLSVDPNLGAYYANAKKRSGESIGDAMAARGLTGSSFEQNRLANSYTDLDAERAGKEAQYKLDRAQTMGFLGAGADTQRRSFMEAGGNLLGQTARNDIEGTRTGMDILGDVDRSRLDTVNSGMTAGLATQGAMEGRIRGGIEDVSGAWMLANNATQEAFKNLFGTDIGMEDAINAVGPAKVKAAIEGDKAARDEIIQAASVGVNAIK